jgi:hypothetical protein
MINVNQITSTLARMQLPELQQYAALHKNDPYIVSLAMSVANQKKQAEVAKNGLAGMQPQPKVVDQQIAQMVAPQMPPQQQMPQGQPQMPPQQAQQRLPEDSGIGQLPAQNMQGMADGGIVGYAEGGVPRFNGMTGSVPQLGYEELAKLYQKDPALAREAALRAGPIGQRFLAQYQNAVKVGGVPAAVLEGGMIATTKAASDLSKYTTPEQRREMSSNPMLSAMSGDAGAAAATMDAKRNNPSGPSTMPYLTQMKNVAGAGIDALGAMGKHLISAPGYGFSSMSKPGEVEPGRIAMPQSTISGTGDTTEIDNLAAQMQAEKAKTQPTGGQPTTGTTGGRPTRPGANTGAGPATPTGGIDALQRENDAIARLKSNVVGGAETEINKTAFLDEANAISKPAYDKANAMIEKEKGRLKEGKDQDFYMALIEGGLAAAGETGPNGLQNLAKGFSKGAASYRDALKDFRKATQENAKMEVDLSRAEAAEKVGNLKTYYERMDKYQDRKLKRDDNINQGIAQIINTGVQGQNQKDVAHISGGYHVASSRASANAQRELMEALGNAEPDSALRKGFDLQKTIAQQAALYEQYQKMLMDPATGMERPDVRKIYPNFQTYLAEYEKAIANKGAPGGGIKTIADPSKTQQPVMQR